MGILDDADRTLSQWGQSASETIKNMSKFMRLSSAIREEEEKQKELFQKIGEYVYENELGMTEEQIVGWCRDISESRERAMQNREQMTALKGMINCPKCGASIALNSTFCSVCGSRLEELNSSPKQEENESGLCPNCGRKVDKDAAFCIYCGTKIPDGQPQIEETEVIPKDICPNCGNKIKSGQTFCIKCGVKLPEQ